MFSIYGSGLIDKSFRQNPIKEARGLHLRKQDLRPVGALERRDLMHLGNQTHVCCLPISICGGRLAEKKPLLEAARGQERLF